MVIALLAGAGFLAAQEASPAPTPAAGNARPRFLSECALPGLERKISLDLTDPMEVVDLIKFLATKGEINVIIGREVTGTTKLMIKDVTVGEALDIVLAANGLAYEVKGNIVKIMTDREYRELHGEGFYEQKQVRIVSLRYAKPSQMAQILGEVKSSIGKLVADDTTGTLVLIDTPGKIREMEEVIRRTELPTVERVLPTLTTNFVLQYADVDELEPHLTPLLTKEIGRVTSDKRTKTLVVTDLPHNLAKIAQVVRLFDRETKQVFIEAKIVQIKLSDTFKLGVDWNHVYEAMDPRFSLQSVSQFGLGLGARSETTPNPSFASLSYHTIAAGGDLNAVVEALSTMGDTKVISNPHIATLDGREATIKVVEDQPYAELTYEVGTTNITGKTYKFIPVGVTLTVRPHINEAGFITMDISPEISTVIGTYDTSGGQGVPIVKKSHAETSVTVKDGVTIIIAGLINEIKDKQVARVPLLGQIPLVGALFRWHTEATENAETIVFLTPRIVTGAQPFYRTRDMKKSPQGARVGSAALGGMPATEETP